MREDIRELILGNNTCVLASVSGREPHCSLMSYVASEDCREIYMVTLKDTKKYRNLLENPSVSLLIDSRERDRLVGHRSRAKALTVTGAAVRALDERRKSAIRKQLLVFHPDLHLLIDQPDAEILVVGITAVQLLDGLTDAYFETVV